MMSTHKFSRATIYDAKQKLEFTRGRHLIESEGPPMQYATGKYVSFIQSFAARRGGPGASSSNAKLQMPFTNLPKIEVANN